jgi:hypothetical protein
MTEDLVAVHESAHAVVAHVLGHEVVGVSLRPAVAEARFRGRGADRARDELVALLAGDAAVVMQGGKVRSWSDAADVRDLVARRGLTDEDLLAARLAALALAIEHERSIGAVARELVWERRLSGEEVAAIVEEVER